MITAEASFDLDADRSDVPAASRPEVSSFPIEVPRLKIKRNHRQRRDGVSAVIAPSLPYFIVGNENRLAWFLASCDPASLELSDPLLILGTSGVGKSTLALHLAARAAITRGTTTEPATAHALPAIDFARQYAEAIASDDLAPLQQQIDQTPVLVMDDIHLLAEKPAAQDELATRLESRSRLGHLTILTSRRSPADVRGLRPRLVSRTLGGLSLTMVPPGPAARSVLIAESALMHDVTLTPEMIALLSAGLPADATYPALEAAIKQISLLSRMNQQPAGIDVLQRVIDTSSRDRELSINDITKSVARYFQLKSSDLKSSSRQQRIVRARSLAMLMARRMTSHSLQSIGQHFGGRDHSTVLHAIGKTESLLDTDADLRRAIAEVSERLAA